MFNQIEDVYANWVEGQEDLLNETQLLVFSIKPELGEMMQNFIDRLKQLDLSSRNAFLSDHIFYIWHDQIKEEILNFYEGDHPILNLGKLTNTITLLNLAATVLLKQDFDFCVDSTTEHKFLLPGSGLFFNYAAVNKVGHNICCKYLSNSASLEIDGSVFLLLHYDYVNSIKVANANFDFFSDPSGDEYNIELDTEIDTTMWCLNLEKALAIVNSDAHSRKIVSLFTSYLVPLKQKEVIKNLSFSVRNLPGVIFKNDEQIPYLVGETLVHESDHQFFYAIEKFANFWKSDYALQMPVYFSPWRDDPRPLDGILRGLSSFARVSQYYSSAIRQYLFTPRELEQVSLMLIQRLRESEVAFDTVQNSNQLTDFGVQFIAEIQETLNFVNEIAKSLPLYHKWNQVALDTIEEHKKVWRLNNNIDV